MNEIPLCPHENRGRTSVLASQSFKTSLSCIRSALDFASVWDRPSAAACSGHHQRTRIIWVEADEPAPPWPEAEEGGTCECGESLRYVSIENSVRSSLVVESECAPRLSADRSRDWHPSARRRDHLAEAGRDRGVAAETDLTVSGPGQP